MVFPEHLEVADAFGAYIAQLGYEEELVINTMPTDENEALEQLFEKVKKSCSKMGR